jgi:acylphosphatase
VGALTIRVCLLVRGRVQGVGYRWFARDAAAGMGVAGWVHNLPDGRVEIEAEGAPEAVESFIRELQTGLPFARVDEVQRSDIQPKGEKSFEIH